MVPNCLFAVSVVGCDGLFTWNIPQPIAKGSAPSTGLAVFSMALLVLAVVYGILLCFNPVQEQPSTHY